MEKLKLEMNSGLVQETLLIPLYARYLENRREDYEFKDPYAEEIIEKIQYDFSSIHEDWPTRVGIIVRTKIFDEITKEFCQSKENPLVINIGAGLDTRYFRICLKESKLENVQWFDIDLPEVISLKERFFGSSSHYKYIKADLLQHSWMEEVKNSIGVSSLEKYNILIIAEGLFMYFPEDNLKKLIDYMIKNVNNAELAFSFAHPFLVLISSRFKAIKSTGNKFSWGKANIKKIEEWNSKLKYKQEFHYYNRLKHRWKFYKINHYVPILRNLLKIAHFQIIN